MSWIDFFVCVVFGKHYVEIDEMNPPRLPKSYIPANIRSSLQHHTNRDPRDSWLFKNIP